MRVWHKLGAMALLAIVLGTSGCMTWTAKIDDMSNIYAKQKNTNGPKIIMTNLADRRNDTALVGQISALKLATKPGVNIIITNRIASKLMEQGFNVQKAEAVDIESKSVLMRTLESNGGKIIFTGKLNEFYIESMDAILESAKGRVSFSVNMRGESEGMFFFKIYAVSTEKYIGLGGGQGSEKFINETVEATVNKLFNDTAFQEFLAGVRRG